MAFWLKFENGAQQMTENHNQGIDDDQTTDDLTDEEEIPQPTFSTQHYLPPAARTETPAELNALLLPHQLNGLSRMLSQEIVKKMGGINSDDMVQIRVTLGSGQNHSVDRFDPGKQEAKLGNSLLKDNADRTTSISDGTMAARD